MKRFFIINYHIIVEFVKIKLTIRDYDKNYRYTRFGFLILLVSFLNFEISRILVISKILFIKKINHFDA